MSSIEKKKLIHYVLYIFAIIAIFYAIELVRLASPLFEKIYFGYITPMILDVMRIILYIILIVVAMKYAKKHFQSPCCVPSDGFPLKRVILLYGITLLVVFIVSASLSFRLKVVVDLGENIGAIYLYNNLANIITSLVRMGIVVLIIRYSTEVFELLVKKSWASYVPFGGLVSLVSIGLFELLIVPNISAIHIVFLFMHLLYGEIYLLSYKYFPTTLAISVIIHLL